MLKINKSDCTIVAKELLESITKKITGDDEEWLFGKKPSDSVMIGMVGGCKKESSIFKGEEVDDKKFESIPSIGIRFRFNPVYSKAKVIVKGKFFYRVIPSYEDEIKYLVSIYSKQYGNEKIYDKDSLIKFFEECKKDQNFIEPKIDIVKVYKSVNLSELGEIEIDLNDAKKAQEKLDSELFLRLNKKIDEINPYSISCKKTLRNVSQMYDEESFKRILNSSVNQVNILWEIKTYCSVNKYENYSEFLLQLINYTGEVAPLSYEEQIFNGGLIVIGERNFIPIEINSVKYDYSDKPTLPAIGNNCSVIGNNNRLETENMPVYLEHRVLTVNRFNDYITFTHLIDNPIENLLFIFNKMKEKLNKYKEQLNLNYVQEFAAEISDFEHEVNRFKRGIDLINNKSDVRQAFKLMNKTFAKNPKYVGWRLFQIVFIVSELPDLVNSEYENTPGFGRTDIDNVDLIYFSTGGGKTETFLGCCVFSAFFDRLRGKNEGATAIIKYPLRLLAAQQLDRVLKLTINANIVKTEENLPGDDFSVGFFTGSGNTPNKIDENKKIDIDNWEQNTKNQNYRQIDVCPICQQPMNVYFDADSWVLKHKCSNKNCGFEPPIYIVDDEIYRKTPTFVISTIDKMANIGTSLGFKGLFGQTKYKCPMHGAVLGKKCSVPHCNCQIIEDINKKDPIPTLFIQDEMHLVNESLGTFDSHYESLIQYYCESLVPPSQRKKIKYIGATATIQNFESQIYELYNKNAKKFPTSVKKENFYSYIDANDISRIIVGAALYGGSITDSIQKIVTLSRVIVSNWYNDLDGFYNTIKDKGFIGNKEELREILSQYLIEIIYNNSKNDAGTLRAILENQGNNTLRAENLPTFDIAEITGDVEFKTIKSVMHEIESNNDKYKTKNVVIATSAISHGVDEDCFNQIFFFGMPNQTSEYIQAYSRVGRTYTGIVFDIFRIIRDKDKSYLKNFYNYHEYKERLIDPVPINRYAKNAIYSTLPGIVSALIYQNYAKEYSNYSAMNVTSLIKEGVLTLEKFKADIENIYGCDRADSQLYKNIIDKEIVSIFDGFKNNINKKDSVADLIKRCNSMHKEPMTNLRDVDVGLEIELKGEK